MSINNFLKKLRTSKFFFLGIEISEALIRIARIRILNSSFFFNLNRRTFYINFDSIFSKYIRIKKFNFFLLNLSILKEFFYLNFKIIKIIFNFNKSKKTSHTNFDILYYSINKHQDIYIEKLLKKGSFSYKKLLLVNFRPSINHILNFFFDYFDLFKIKYEIISINRALDHYKPKLLICIEGNKHQDYLLASIAKNKKIQSLCLQWGVFIEDFPNISLQNMNFDYFFSWGNFFSNNLKKFNKKTKFINVGNFNFSDNLKVKNKKIVFILQPTNEYYCSSEMLNEYNSFINWCITELDEKIIIRTHPLYKKSVSIFQKNPNVTIHDSLNVPLHKTFENAKICFGLYSSALVESACSGITSVFFFKKNIFIRFNKKLLYNKNIFLADTYLSMKSFITNKNKFGAQIKFKENSKYFIIKGSNKSIEYSNKIIKKIINKDYISKVNLIK